MAVRRRFSFLIVKPIKNSKRNAQSPGITLPVGSFRQVHDAQGVGETGVGHPELVITRPREAAREGFDQNLASETSQTTREEQIQDGGLIRGFTTAMVAPA